VRERGDRGQAGATGAVLPLLSGRLALLACCVCASALAQPPKHVRIGIVAPPEASSPVEEGLREGLRELGCAEAEVVAIETRRTPDSRADLERTAAEFKQAKVQVIVAFSTPAAKAMMTATSTPVVFLAGGDPVASGLAASLARPGGSATGIALQLLELTAKRIELLHQLAPKARRIGVLVNTQNPVGNSQLDEAAAAAARMGLRAIPVDVHSAAELDDALQAINRNTVDAVLVTGDLLLFGNKGKIAKALREGRVPAIFPNPLYHDEGVLSSFGPDVRAAASRLARYVGRILNGANPGDLPVEQASKHQLVIDLRVAREMKLQVPQDLLLRADEVIR
jgi:putative ABC transport system substrate-binding protein